MPTLHPAMLEPGDEFHGLRIHSVLGEGAMGAAFLASHPVLRTPLILKTFKVSQDEDLFREAHLAARVQSPYVVGVIDAGYENRRGQDVPFVVQRYVDGMDLEELLKRMAKMGRRVPTNVVATLTMQVARGLHAVHQAGVVHRDIKPANLFVGGNGVAMVGDFGIAAGNQEPDPNAPVVGTPLFMAPEQWENRADRRADLYALGATAHLLAMGKPPFAGETVAELAHAHVNQEYVPPRCGEARQAFLFAALGRCLRKERDERYGSGEALASDLELIVKPPARVQSGGGDAASCGPLRIWLNRGSLADAKADVIVNSANVGLQMRSGVGASLAKAGGKELVEEAASHAPARMGDVVWTSAGNLRAKHVAHAVAALEGAICIQRCTLRVLLEAEALQARSIAFPALGTGIGEVPMELAAELTFEAFRTFAALNPRNVRELLVYLYDEDALARWKATLAAM